MLIYYIVMATNLAVCAYLVQREDSSKFVNVNHSLALTALSLTALSSLVI